MLPQNHSYVVDGKEEKNGAKSNRIGEEKVELHRPQS